jgi:imidazolonepropionase-like amidohydrolase
MTRIVFRGANLLDGKHPAQPNRTVVVEQDRITTVAENDAVTAGPEDRVVELGGKTLMPGMILSHYHSTYDGITIMPEPLGLEKPPGYLMLVAARKGVIEGPRLMPGGLALDTTGDYNDTGKYWWRLGNKGGQRFCDGPDEFRKAVREEVKRGVDIIKIFASGGHGVPEASDTRGFAQDELRSIIETAHHRGKRVRAHCAWRDMILECVREGIDLIDHGDEADDECIDAMAERRTFLCPSLFFVKQLLDYSGELQIATPEQMEPVRREFENACANVPKANAAGVRLVSGDDYGIINLPHGRYAEELDFYVKTIGIAPLDVLHWATVNGAELMKRGHELGSIEAGKLADLLVVDGDPSVDIAVLQDRSKLRAIMKGGGWVKDALAPA